MLEGRCLELLTLTILYLQKYQLVVVNLEIHLIFRHKLVGFVPTRKRIFIIYYLNAYFVVSFLDTWGAQESVNETV